MTTDDAIRMYGSAAKLARALGVGPSAVGNWKVRGIPRRQVLELELIQQTDTRAAYLRAKLKMEEALAALTAAIEGREE